MGKSRVVAFPIFAGKFGARQNRVPESLVEKSAAHYSALRHADFACGALKVQTAFPTSSWPSAVDQLAFVGLHKFTTAAVGLERVNAVYCSLM